MNTSIDASRHAPAGRFGRIPICNVTPVIQCGTYPAKAVTDEAFPVQANIFREGHDAVAAVVVLTAPDGRCLRTEMKQIEPMGLDIWQAWVRPDVVGDWSFHVEAYSDRWRTWQHNAATKFALGLDLPLMCAEGIQLCEEALASARAADDAAAQTLLQANAAQLTSAADPEALIAVTSAPDVDAAMVAYLPHHLSTPTVDFPLQVDRKAAQFSAWYEFFPRSYQAVQRPDGSWQSGTLRGSFAMLERIAKLGFDVAYIPPINPIGNTFRKGPNNTLTPGPFDPGSPWAIGNVTGGHDAVHPDLGTIDDFDAFVAKAHSLGLEVALDFALQASPDHPWVREHPEFFTTRLDGTIAYAENPPKKYQDIYPINFDNDPDGIYHEVLRLLNFWIDHGVTIFRVDNPHTKPIDFWAWLMREVHREHPEVLFQAEAFTRPEMMQALGKVGFHLSYTYFIWRNTRHELETYLHELSTQTAAAMRPNFFTNTPDINPYFTQSGNPAAFAIRLILATTMSPCWGMYSGFELCEHAVLKMGGEEYLNSERFEYRPRDYNAEPNLNLLVTQLNRIRHQHPALQQIRQTTVHSSDSDSVFVFSKTERDDTVIVVCSLDPDNVVQTTVHLDLDALHLAPAQFGVHQQTQFGVHDELSGADFVWGEHNFVSLRPDQPAHILHVQA